MTSVLPLPRGPRAGAEWIEQTAARGTRAPEDPAPSSQTISSWPAPMAQAAYHGLAGDFVRMIEPRSESDPAALLAQVLVSFGSIVGRSAHFSVEASRHFANLFVVLVGETSKARKGSSWSPVKFVFKMVDADWPVETGLSSGEGLIWTVRDAIVKQEPVKEKRRIVRYEQVEVDAGVTDKRLLIFQPEFATTLHTMERDGNILSGTIRQAWDEGDLRAMTKNSPARSSGAHISIVGHVTKDELLRYLDRTEVANGFANRIAWICVRRSKLLPEGGELEDLDYAPLVTELRDTVLLARQRGQLRRDADARELWHQVYRELSEGRPGLLGAILSRAEAQVMRLALVYALLDRAEAIGRVHLEAAIAFWKYAEASARFVFGDSLGDPDADAVLSALRSSADGLTRDEIVNLFGRHRQRSQIDRILGKLTALGLAEMTRETTGGRPAERWRGRS